ncbi:MAG: glycosyltransferase family 2 protein [Bacteroidales bacterium]|nr:glycosyltransferase family 2 protein [Bacteroidales bacterium]
MVATMYVFWGIILIVFYSYFGYGLLLWILLLFKKKKQLPTTEEFPEITFLVPAYNEQDFVDEKAENGFALDYPKEKIHFVWVTDGSNDGTLEKLKDYPIIETFHSDERRGKTAALNRAIELIDTEIIICSDANTLLNKEAIKEMVRLFADPEIGTVAGEKKVLKEENDDASGSGENFYWKYESWLKQLDAEFYSSVAVVGELFAIRKVVFSIMPEDTLLDDFVLSLKTIEKNLKIGYTKNAYAMEKASASVSEEMKRKVRIAAGGFQTVFRYPQFLNPFRYPIYAFQYFSHKFLRWFFVPLALPITFLLNIWLVWLKKDLDIYGIILILQTIFYGSVLLGWLLQNKKTKMKLLFVPFYIFMMNWSTFKGMIRYFSGNQSANWEKAARRK